MYLFLVAYQVLLIFFKITYFIFCYLLNNIFLNLD
nr:MAG TPA: hypothetical protein [Caudoviricetes sp.]